MKALLALGGLAIAVVILITPWIPQIIYPVFAMTVMCYVLFACAFNLLLGFGGMLSFGHAAFFATAAYTTGYVLKALGWTTGLGILAGVGSSALLGVVFGLLATRRSGIYLAMITLALAQLCYFAFLELPFTGGSNGMREIPRGELFGFIDLGNDVAIYYFVVVLTLAGLFIVYRTVHSPFGHRLRALREHEDRAISLGYNTTALKVLAFGISAGLSGLAGSMKAVIFGIAALGDAHWTQSGNVVLMALVGGTQTVFGPALGAILFIVMQYYLDAFASWVAVIIGAVFILNILLFKKGILGTVFEITDRRRASSESREPN